MVKIFLHSIATREKFVGRVLMISTIRLPENDALEVCDTVLQTTLNSSGNGLKYEF